MKLSQYGIRKTLANMGQVVEIKRVLIGWFLMFLGCAIIC